MQDKSYLTLLLIHFSKKIARPKDVRVVTLTEMLFLPSIIKYIYMYILYSGTDHP